MKRIVLFGGLLLVLLNTIAGLIWSDHYSVFNMLFVDASILLSILSIWLLFWLPIADGFRIGFMTVFIVTGLIRLACAAIASNQFQGNAALMTFLVMLALEASCLFLGTAMNKK